MKHRGWKPYSIKGTDGKWYRGWKNASGEIVEVGGQPYSTKWSAKRAANTAMKRMADRLAASPDQLRAAEAELR